MNESIRQKTATQPQRQIGSVPVLFSIRNVQPKIVGAISQAKPSDSLGTETVPTSPAIAFSSVAETTTAITPKTTAPSSSNNRAYNVAVGLLVIALCFLVIRNTQSSKGNSRESIAANTTASPADSKPLSNLKVELVPPALPNPTTLKPIDLEPASASSPKPAFSMVSNTSEIADTSLPSQPLIQNPLPTLLNSKAVPSSDEITGPANGSVENSAVDTTLSFPEPSVAVTTGASQNTGYSTHPIDLSQSNLASSANGSTNSYRPEVGNVNATNDEGKTGVLDSNSPTLTSRELYEMKELHELIEMRKSAKNSVAPNALNGQPYPETSVRATTVSNIAPVLNMPPASPTEEPGGSPTGYKPYSSRDQGPRDPSIMTGRSYSTAPQEFPALTVPSYERDAFANRQVSPTAPQNQMIRQPSTKDGNRYPATTQTPYAPLPPVQNGSSFGYPPGK